MWKLFFVLLLSGCFMPIVEVKVNDEVVESCKNFCKESKYNLTYRNENSYFCSCLENNKSIVIGSMGTIYK